MSDGGLGPFDARSAYLDWRLEVDRTEALRGADLRQCNGGLRAL